MQAWMVSIRATLLDPSESTLSDLYSLAESSSSAFRQFLLCYLGAKDLKRDVVRSDVLTMLERNASQPTEATLPRCLWLAEWLAVSRSAARSKPLFADLCSLCRLKELPRQFRSCFTRVGSRPCTDICFSYSRMHTKSKQMRWTPIAMVSHLDLHLLPFNLLCSSEVFVQRTQVLRQPRSASSSVVPRSCA
jgi:hypothetical protein